MKRPLGCFHSQKELSLQLSGVDHYWETYPSALTDIIFSALLTLSLVNEAILVRAKDSNGTTVKMFNLLHGHCTLLPFPSALMSLRAPDEEK